MTTPRQPYFASVSVTDVETEKTSPVIVCIGDPVTNEILLAIPERAANIKPYQVPNVLRDFAEAMKSVQAYIRGNLN